MQAEKFRMVKAYQASTFDSLIDRFDLPSMLRDSGLHLGLLVQSGPGERVQHPPSRC